MTRHSLDTASQDYHEAIGELTRLANYIVDTGSDYRDIGENALAAWHCRKAEHITAAIRELTAAIRDGAEYAVSTGLRSEDITLPPCDADATWLHLNNVD